MKKIIYLIYKTINIIVFRMQTKYSLSRGSKNICFDLKHHTVHLGDRLFLIDIIFSISKSKFNLIFKQDDNISNVFYGSLGLFSEREIVDFDHTIYIAPKSSYLHLFLRRRHSNYFFIDNESYSGNLAKEIAVDFCNRLGITYYEYKPEINNGNKEKFVVFSNYIDSGWFRKVFCDESLLYNKCIELKSRGYKIVHVGSAADKKTDTRHYAFVDEDLRGATELADIIRFFKDNEVAAVVSYDNVFLHLGNLYNVFTYVLFRGRFSKKATIFHNTTVNPALLRNDKNLMEYLK